METGSGRKRVFLLDDEEDMTLLAGRLLELNGFEILCRNDPHHALSLLLENSYDVIVMDMMMPGMDGLSIIRRLRESPRHAQTPIIILSAKRLTDEERKILIEHRVRFCSKPLGPKELVRIVRESVTPAPDGRDIPARPAP